MRWEHPELGLLLPSAFVPIAESTSLIRPLTQRVLEQALADVARGERAASTSSVAVNLSARCLNDPAFPATVRDLLAGAGVEPARLALELTESAIMADPALTGDGPRRAAPDGRRAVDRRLRDRLLVAVVPAAAARSRS